MESLRALRTELGLSILLLAHTPKRNLRGGLGVNDLQGSKVIANFADNIFAVGQSRTDPSMRYLKHIKVRESQMLFNDEHVLGFRLDKIGGKFLGFTFTGYGTEASHVSPLNEQVRLEKAALVKRLSNEGLSQRAIAKQLGVSAASVNRYLQMYDAEFPARHECIYEDDYLPVEEEVDLDTMTDDERRAMYLAGVADLENDDDPEPASDDIEDVIAHLRPGPCIAVEREPDLPSDIESLTSENPLPPPRDALDEFIRSLNHTTDNNGRDIFVQEFEEGTGKAKIFDRYEPNGMRNKWTRRGFGVFAEIC